MKNNNVYTIGEVANILNISVEDIRQYEYESIIAPSSMGKFNRKLYNDNDINTIRQILSMFSIGFSLEDIKEELN